MSSSHPRGCPSTISFCRIGLAIYFLAVAYFALTLWSFTRYKRVSQYIVNRWNSTKLFHLFIVLDMLFRALALGIIAVFIIFEVSVWSSLLVILYTLPEFLILSVYMLLFFHWLEVFVFSREQFVVTDQASFRKRWHWWWAMLSLVFYVLLGVLYFLVIVKNEQKFDESALSHVEQASGIACMVLPVLGCLLWCYWSCVALSGFPFRSTVEAEKVARTTNVVIVWTVSRIVRGVIVLVSASEKWDDNMNATYLSMVVVASLVVTEWVPIFYALDWGVVGILLIGDEGRNLLQSDTSYARLVDDASLSIHMRLQDEDVEHMWIEAQELNFVSEPMRDDGVIYTQIAKWEERLVSVKVFRVQITNQTEAAMMDELIHDVLKYSDVSHPNILPFLGAGRSDETAYIVTERLVGHTLRDVLNRSAKPFFPETVLNIVSTLAQAMLSIHEHGSKFYHGDLRSSNVMLDSSLTVKVSELGMARLRNYAEIVLVKRLTSAWSAPEVLMGRGCTQASDVYSFGIIMWELWTRKVPFDGRSVDEIRRLVIRDRAQLPIPEHNVVDDAYEQLMVQCWSWEPRDRPTFQQITNSLNTMI